MRSVPFREIARTAFKVYPKRAVLGFSLFIGQAFIYNAVTFTLGLTLTTYLGVAAESGRPVLRRVRGRQLPWAAAPREVCSTPIGRRPMIAGTYLTSAALLVVVAILFQNESFSDWGLTAALGLTFFFASAGASSAYLTVSEIFPMEVRALAIAFFYAIGTAVGGIAGPLLFEKLAATGDPSKVAIGYLIGAAVMAIGGLVELFLGVRAEKASLEDIATPLSAEDDAGDRGARKDRGAPSRARRARACRVAAATGSARARHRSRRSSANLPNGGRSGSIMRSRLLEDALRDDGPARRANASRTRSGLVGGVRAASELRFAKASPRERSSGRDAASTASPTTAGQLQPEHYTSPS